MDMNDVYMIGKKVLYVFRVVGRFAKAMPYILDGKHREGKKSRKKLEVSEK